MIFYKGMILQEVSHNRAPRLAIYQIVGRHEGDWVLAAIDEDSNEVRIRSTAELTDDINDRILMHLESYHGYMDAK